MSGNWGLRELGCDLTVARETLKLLRAGGVELLGARAHLLPGLWVEQGEVDIPVEGAGVGPGRLDAYGAGDVGGGEERLRVDAVDEGARGVVAAEDGLVELAALDLADALVAVDAAGGHDR